MNDDDETITALVAATKKMRPGPARNMAKILVKQLRLQRKYPENKALPKVIGQTVEWMQEKIAEAAGPNVVPLNRPRKR